MTILCFGAFQLAAKVLDQLPYQTHDVIKDLIHGCPTRGPPGCITWLASVFVKLCIHYKHYTTI